MYDENSKFNKIFFKNDVSHVIQSTRSQLQFTTSFLIVKKYNQDVRVEFLRENVSQTKNNDYQCQNQFINYFLFMNVIDYSFAKWLTNYKILKNNINIFFRNLDLQQIHSQFNNFHNIAMSRYANSNGLTSRVHDHCDITISISKFSSENLTI